MGGDDIDEMCKRNSGVEEISKARDQVTRDGFGRLREQIGEKLPPRVGRYHVHGCNLLGVEWQRYRSISKPTASQAYRCGTLGGADLFHQQKRTPDRAIHSNIEVQVHVGGGQIGYRVYGIIYKWANDSGPHIWPDFILLLPFKCFQVETWTWCENSFGRNEATYRTGDCRAHN